MIRIHTTMRYRQQFPYSLNNQLQKETFKRAQQFLTMTSYVRTSNKVSTELKTESVHKTVFIILVNLHDSIILRNPATLRTNKFMCGSFNKPKHLLKE